MKEIRSKEDKAVSPIIATILLIAITVVLAATLVTILGGFTHGVSNTVVTVGATTSEFSTTTTGPYVVYLNISSSSATLANSSVTLEINGATVGTLAHGSSTAVDVSGPSSLTGGSNFKIVDSSKITSLDLIYKGNDIYQSGSISIGVSNTVFTVGATTSEVHASSSNYWVYLNISSSSTNLTASSVTLEINGATVGTLAGIASSTGSVKSISGPSYLNGGASFKIVDSSQVTSLDLIYKGNNIYQSGTISVS